MPSKVSAGMTGGIGMSYFFHRWNRLSLNRAKARLAIFIASSLVGARTMLREMPRDGRSFSSRPSAAHSAL